MEYIYSAMLLHSLGKEITEENVKKVLEVAGAKVDEARVKALVSALEGVNIDEVIEKATMTFAAPAPKEEEKKEEKKEEAKEEEKKAVESATEGLASLFG